MTLGTHKKLYNKRQFYYNTLGKTLIENGFLSL